MTTGRSLHGRKNMNESLKINGFSPLILSSYNMKGIKRLKTVSPVDRTPQEEKSAARWSKKVIDHVFNGKIGFSFKGFHLGKV